MSLELLEKSYSQERFEAFLKEVFNFEAIDSRFKKEGLREQDLKHIDSYKYIGRTKRLADKSHLGFFVFKSKSKNIEKKRVGFNEVIPTLTRKYIVTHALVAIYHEESDVWRLSYVSFNLKDGKQTINTSLKRYTYELGKDIPVKTAKAQIGELLDNKITKELLERVFSVERLNDRFFADYKRLFEKLNGYLIENNFSNFQREKSNIRAFSKKLLGCITFLYFLQKKGWLGVKKVWGDGDKEFLKTTFENRDKDKNFYEEYLTSLFFKALSQKRENDYFELLDCKIPFLNGGLFEKKEFDSEFLMIDDSLFQDIFQTLSQYNFTIIEDTPHDSEVAIDPEMLGKVFENLLEENYKSGKGAFYTPREIVHYMCKESIYEYLVTNDKENKEAIRELVFNGVVTPTIDKKTIKEKIKAIKILDPAIGSGAFPMGLLSELIHILETIDDKLDVVQEKIDIIQNSIYGIDIDPSAVEIAQLRFWLSIVVDEKIPRALPNLDFKIMIGNSLLETIDAEDPLKPRRGLNEKLNGLTKIFKEFYSAHNDDKNQLRVTISKDLKVIFKPISKKYSNQVTMQDTKKDIDNRFKARNISNIFKQLTITGFSDKIFLYKLFFKDVLDNGGFNIIIGNPPYLRVQGIDKEVSSQYKQQFKSATGSYDLYVLFVEKGLSLLAKDGILNYIMPHKWINSAFGKGLREVSKDNLLKFISFGAYQVFNASTYTSLIWFKKSKVKTLKYIESNRDLTTNIELEKYLFNLKDNDYTNIKNSELTKESWVFTDKKTYEVLQKINRHPLRVKDVFEKIFTGLQTSKDSVYFLKDCKIRDNLVSAYSDELKKEITIEKGLVKPLLKGDDVHRYEKLKTDKMVIFPYYIEEDKAVLYREEELKEKFLNGYKYLKECEDILRGRERGKLKNDDYWFRYIYPKNLTLFQYEKLLTPYLSLGSQLSYDKYGEFYGNTKCFGLIKKVSIKESYKFYLALLNSKLMWFFIKNTSLVFSGGYYTYNTKVLEPFPLPKIENLEDTKPFEVLVDYIMSAKEKDLTFEALYFESVINGMVYDLYFKEEMKKGDSFISDEVAKVIKEFNGKKDMIEEMYKIFKENKRIERGLDNRENIELVKIIERDKK